MQWINEVAKYRIIVQRHVRWENDCNTTSEFLYQHQRQFMANGPVKKGAEFFF
jgi:hypothetical protein